MSRALSCVTCLAAAGLLLGCGPTSNQVPDYSDVEVDIVSPLDGSEHSGDEPVFFEATARHEDGEDADYIVAIWIDSQDGALAPTELSFSDYLSPGGHSLRLTVYFADGSSSNDEVFLRVGGLVPGTYLGSVEGTAAILGTPGPCPGSIELNVSDSGSVGGVLECSGDFLGSPFPLTWSVDGSIVDGQLTASGVSSDGLSEALTLTGSLAAGEIIGTATGAGTSLSFVATL